MSTPAPEAKPPAMGSIVGHTRLVDMVRRAIASGRMHHAWLFLGPDGVGKTTMARAMEGLLLCERRAPGDAERCGACPSCHMLADGSHPDAMELAPDGRFIKLEAVRAVLAATRYRPAQAKVRVVRILDAECLREEAANALLKTLEEPGGETFFQLVTSNPARLLTTIRSRCMPLRFGPLAHADVVRVLAGFGHEGSAASDAARLAGGSPGLAMHRIASTAFGQREGMLAAFLEAIGGSDADALQHAHELAGDRGGLDETLTVLRTLVRDAAILTTGASERNLMDPSAIRMARELARMGTASVVRIAQKIEEIDALLAGNVNARLCMESLLLECVQAARGARAGG